MTQNVEIGVLVKLSVGLSRHLLVVLGSVGYGHISVSIVAHLALEGLVKRRRRLDCKNKRSFLVFCRSVLLLERYKG